RADRLPAPRDRTHGFVLARRARCAAMDRLRTAPRGPLRRIRTARRRADRLRDHQAAAARRPGRGDPRLHDPGGVLRPAEAGYHSISLADGAPRPALNRPAARRLSVAAVAARPPRAPACGPVLRCAAMSI